MGGTGCWDLFPASITFPLFPQCTPGFSRPLFSLMSSPGAGGCWLLTRAAHPGGEDGEKGAKKLLVFFFLTFFP